jgi:hypothetical protein
LFRNGRARWRMVPTEGIWAWRHDATGAIFVMWFLWVPLKMGDPQNGNSFIGKIVINGLTPLDFGYTMIHVHSQMVFPIISQERRTTAVDGYNTSSPNHGIGVACQVLWTSGIRPFISSGARKSLQALLSGLEVRPRMYGTCGGFLSHGGTPKSSIYRWIFHYKPSIFGVPPF